MMSGASSEAIRATSASRLISGSSSTRISLCVRLNSSIYVGMQLFSSRFASVSVTRSGGSGSASDAGRSTPAALPSDTA